MSSAAAPRIKYSASVVITDPRRRSGLAENRERLRHLFNLVIEATGNWSPVTLRKDPCVQKQIQCVNVVVDGLFEVDSICLNLSLGFFHQDVPTDRFPFRCRPNFRAKRAHKEKGYRFAN